MAAVARALVSRGHEVVFASGRAHEEDATRAGATFWELPISRGSPRHALEPYLDAEDMARMMAPGVAAMHPDVAVVDLITLGAALAAEMCDVPVATLCIHPLHTPSRVLPPFGWGRAPGRGPLKLRDGWMRRHAMRDLERARDALNQARAHLGLDPVARIDAQLSKELILVATFPSLEIARPDWPPHAHVVGPCLWDEGSADPVLPVGGEPLVLVAATTAHSDQAEMVRASLYAIERNGARGFVTTGATRESFKASSKVCIVGHASHDAVLRRAAAVICSGGHGIVARALSHGVPLVVVPGHGDQRENGFRVARAGAGVLVPTPGARALERALARVLGEGSFTRRAGEIAAEANAFTGPARAADLVEALISSRAMPR